MYKDFSAGKMPLHYKNKCHICYTIHKNMNTATNLSNNKYAMVKTDETNIVA